MIGRVVWLGVIAVGGGGIFYMAHPGARSCEDLVKIGNVAVAAANGHGEPNAVLATLDDAARQMRIAAPDYKSPFDSDATLAAGSLDQVTASVRAGDLDAFNRAVAQFNALVDRTNADCSDASGGVNGK